MYGDGSTRRDYTIDDIVDGMYKHGALPRLQYLQFGRVKNNFTERFDRAYRIELGQESKDQKLPMQPGDVETTYADIKKAKDEIEYNPQIDIEFGIEKFVEWFKANA